MPLLAEERLPKKGNPIGIVIEPLKLSECGLGTALRQCCSRIFGTGRRAKKMIDRRQKLQYPGFPSGHPRQY
jgi:hypothetical protein